MNNSALIIDIAVNLYVLLNISLSSDIKTALRFRPTIIFFSTTFIFH